MKFIFFFETKIASTLNLRYEKDEEEWEHNRDPYDQLRSKVQERGFLLDEISKVGAELSEKLARSSVRGVNKPNENIAEGTYI